MAVRWDLLQPVDVGARFQQGFEQGRQMVERERAKSALAAFSANPMDPQAQNALAALSPEFSMRLAMQKQELAMKRAEKERLGAYFAAPDRKASREQALRAGEIDVAKQLADMDEETRKRAIEEAKGAAPFIYEAQKLPYEQRKDFLRSQSAALTNIGFTPEEIEAYDPTDANNAGFINIATTLEQARQRDTKKWVTRQDGSMFAVDDFGNPVGDPTGGGASRQAPAAQPEAATGEFSFTPVPGAHVTSGYRSAADNRRVGGVANSFHLSGRARDFTPPPGMSMDELYRETLRLNPGLDVINEGDHVHIEPKGHPGAPAFAGNPKEDAIRQQAVDAINAGADPSAVAARAAKMGVTL